jgi:hypothetical protein
MKKRRSLWFMIDLLRAVFPPDALRGALIPPMMYPRLWIPLPFRRVLLFLFTIGIALVAWFGLITAFPMPTKPLLWIRNDHLLHVCAFSWLSLTGLLLWEPGGIIIALLVVGAGLLELLQNFFPAHQMSLVDWSASSSGVGLGAVLFALVRATLARRLAAALAE